MQINKKRIGSKVNKETGLTPKEERFARLVAEGRSNTEAYIEAYENPDIARSSARSLAYKVSQRPNVQAKTLIFKREFASKLDIASEITIERQIRYSQKAVQETLKEGDWNNYLKALDMQNKLVGIYAPTQLESKNLNVNLTKVPDGGVDV
jgi:hypothetical protein